MFPQSSRRRFIAIAGAAAGFSLLPFGKSRAEAPPVSWRGQAMGAVAAIDIHHEDRGLAQKLIERAVAEVRRLESIFSLYRDDSAISRLNRNGFLIAPPAELVELLSDCGRFHGLTGGAFDPTVQALWTVYWRHFSQENADPRGPSPEAVEAALSSVGFDKMRISPDRIAFAARGMGLTLNGVAQGYATDAVVKILQSGGIERTLVDMGEPRAIGGRSPTEPWRIGVADPDAPSTNIETIEARNEAVATSGGYGFRFDAEGRFNHLFNPHTGGCARRYKSVTCVMPTATVADMLSTAFSVMAPEDIAMTLRELGVGRAHIVAASGEKAIFGV